MPDSEPELFTSVNPQKDLTSTPVGAGISEVEEDHYISHHNMLRWIEETKNKLPRCTPKLRREAFLADPLINGTIHPYMKNVLLKGFSIETKDNKLYAEAQEEIRDWIESLGLIKAFRDDYLDYGFLTGHSYRRMDLDPQGNVISLEKLDPASITTYTDSWDSSIVAYHQRALVKKGWSRSSFSETVDSWFIPYTLKIPEIPITVSDINSTYVDGRGTGNDLRVFDLFKTFQLKYSISDTMNLRVAAAERIIAMHKTELNDSISRHHDYEDYDYYGNAPIDSVILAIWLKRLLLTNAPNLIYAVLSPFIHVISGVLQQGKDELGKPALLSSIPKKPNPALLTTDPTTYNTMLANHTAWVDSIKKAGREVVNSLKNGGAYVSGPDIALKVIESGRSVSFQLVKGLIDQLNEEICQAFGLPMALISAKGSELATSRTVMQLFNSAHAGDRTDYETVANKLIDRQFEGKVWQGKTVEKDENGNEKTNSYSYTFEEIKAHFVLEIPDTKDLLNEAQTFKTRAEGLVQVKALGASREDLQALGEEAGLGLLGLDNFDVQASPEETINDDSIKQVAAILKACLIEDLEERGLISAKPTDPSNFKDEELTKKLRDAYKTAQETILEVFDGED